MSFTWSLGSLWYLSHIYTRASELDEFPASPACAEFLGSMNVFICLLATFMLRLWWITIIFLLLLRYIWAARKCFMDLPDGRWGFWMGKCATISQPAEERLPYWCQEINRKNEGGKLKYFFTVYLKWAIAFNIRTPGWGPIFSSYPSRLNKIAFTLQDFIKIMGLPLKIVGPTYEE